jgi:predicted HTH domain antitoxin
VNDLVEKLSIIIPAEMKKEMDQIRGRSQEDQSALVRRLLRKSITVEKLDIAIKDYVDDKVSLGSAAAFAGVSIWEMIDELKRRNVGLKYKIVDAQEEIEKILQRHRVKL